MYIYTYIYGVDSYKIISPKTFQVPKMEVRTHRHISCMGTAYVRENLHPKIAKNKLGTQDSSILDTWNSCWWVEIDSTHRVVQLMKSKEFIPSISPPIELVSTHLNHFPRRGEKNTFETTSWLGSTPPPRMSVANEGLIVGIFGLEMWQNPGGDQHPCGG